MMDKAKQIKWRSERGSIKTREEKIAPSSISYFFFLFSAVN